MSEAVFTSIPAGWELTTLGDVCEQGGGLIQTGPFGSQLHSSDYVDSGIPVIMPVNIAVNRIVIDGIAKITEMDANRLSRHRVIPGDIVYSRRGDVERRALVRTEQEGWLCGTGCLLVRVGDCGSDPSFTSFYLAHPVIREWIVRHSIGATMPNLNTGILKQVPFLLPPKDEQRTIASILTQLDDKIELNRRMSDTLEAIARAIFKSWFVDFDPVRAKADGRQLVGMDAETATLFPDSFEDSELGKIPCGWAVNVLDDLTTFVLGGDWGKGEEAGDFIIPAYCIRGADIPSLQVCGKGNMPARMYKKSSLDKRQLAHGDIVIEISGGSPTQSTGRSVFVSRRFVERFECPVVYSNFCRMFRLKDNDMPTYIYMLLRWLYTNDGFLSYENGTTGIKNFAFTEFSRNHKFVTPPKPILSIFDSVVSSIFDSMHANEAQSETLVQTRDLLLPKLISGEIRVKDAEKFVEEHVG